MGWVQILPGPIGGMCGSCRVSMEEGIPRWAPGGLKVSREVEVGGLEDEPPEPYCHNPKGQHQSLRLELGVAEVVLHFVMGGMANATSQPLHTGTAQATASPSQLGKTQHAL